MRRSVEREEALPPGIEVFVDEPLFGNPWLLVTGSW
jgi:hypothetical protein